MRRLVWAVIGAWAVAGLAPAESAEASTPPRDDLQQVELISGADLVVRLLVRAEASLADEHWIGLEFENQTEQPLAIKDLHYDLDRKAYDPRTDRPLASGGMASGRPFPDDWPRSDHHAYLLAPGRHVLWQHPSRYASALLGLPPKQGWHVRGRAYLRVTVGDQNLATPSADERRGRPFAFRWRYPGAAGFEAMRARAAALLAKPEESSAAVHSYILGTLLNVPDVATALPVSSLLEALHRRPTAGFAGRDAIVAVLRIHHHDDPEVVRYYQGQLQAGDERAVNDLARGVGRLGPPFHQDAPEIWRPSFVDPLLGLFETKAAGVNVQRDVLHLLSRHRADWPKEKRIAERLLTRLLALHPALRASPETLDDDAIVHWSRVAPLLEWTHTAAAERYLWPFLEDQRQVVDVRFYSFIAFAQLPATRACDVALETILQLRGRDVPAVYRAAGYDPQSALPESADAVPRQAKPDSEARHETLAEKALSRLQPVRDRLIAALLAGEEPGRESQ